MKAAPVLVVIAALTVLAATAFGQTATFTGLGHLGGGTSKAYGVSSNGSVVVGESGDSSGNTQAFICTTGQGIKGIGFLNPTYSESWGRGVDVDSEGTIHATGYSQVGGSRNQAFRWEGTAAGTGSMTGLPFLPDGDESAGRALRVDPAGSEVFIVGDAEKAHGAIWHGFRWRSGSGGVLDLQDIIDGNSGAYGIGWRPNGTQIIVGVSNSNWWISGSGNHREAFRWDPDWHIVGITGLDYVCGYGFQIAAGDNGVAETTADRTDLQLIDVGTAGLDREEVIISADIDPNGESWLRTIHWSGGGLVGDDLSWPPGHEADGSSESLSNAVSPDGRFSVGRCTYPDETCGYPHPTFRLFQANFHDDELWGHTCNEVTHFPLGFLDDDNYSEALGVSNAVSPDPSREGVVVVGWSLHVGYRILAGANGVAESTAECDDVQEVPVGTSGLAANTVVVSPGPNDLLNSAVASGDSFESYGIGGSQKRAFVCYVHDSYDLVGFEKEMYDLKTYLESQGLDLSDWELTEARGVSDDGAVIVGIGRHNGVEEGWIARVPTPGCPNLPTITSIEPDTAKTGEVVNATVYGSNFVAGETDVRLAKIGESDIVATGVNVAGDGLSLMCNLGLAGAAGGSWDVVVSRPYCPAATLGGGFQVTLCNDPFADADGDGDVDQVDFGTFQACFTGHAGGVPTGCGCFNRHVDADDPDIDEDDYAEFETCASGPAVAADPACDGPVVP
jgi:probable HAF family extracellular repeat protein